MKHMNTISLLILLSSTWFLQAMNSDTPASASTWIQSFKQALTITTESSSKEHNFGISPVAVYDTLPWDEDCNPDNIPPVGTPTTPQEVSKHYFDEEMQQEPTLHQLCQSPQESR